MIGITPVTNVASVPRGNGNKYRVLCYYAATKSVLLLTSQKILMTWHLVLTYIGICPHLWQAEMLFGYAAIRKCYQKASVFQRNSFPISVKLTQCRYLREPSLH